MKTRTKFNLLTGEAEFENQPPWFQLAILSANIALFVFLALYLREWMMLFFLKKSAFIRVLQSLRKKK